MYYRIINDWKQYKGAKSSQMPQLYFVIWRDETIECFNSRLVRALLEFRRRSCELCTEYTVTTTQNNNSFWIEALGFRDDVEYNSWWVWITWLILCQWILLSNQVCGSISLQNKLRVILILFKFSPYENRITEMKRIKLTCKDNTFYSDIVDYGLNSIKCLGNRISPIYESKISMPDCNQYMSLVIGQSFGEYGSIKNVAICYDIVKQQLKYVSYTAYPSKIKVLEQVRPASNIYLS